MRQVTAIVIHHSDTPNGSKKYTARHIDRWHAVNTNLSPRRDEDLKTYNPSFPYIGYHEMIDVAGKCWMGRGENEVACAAAGYNDHGLHVCLFGRDKYTEAQWSALKWVVGDWMRRYGDLRVLGHRDANPGHTVCPQFDVAKWLAGDMEPLQEHLFTK